MTVFSKASDNFLVKVVAFDNKKIQSVNITK